MEKELVSDLAQYSFVSMRFVRMLDDAVLVFPQGVLYPLSSYFGDGHPVADVACIAVKHQNCNFLCQDLV